MIRLAIVRNSLLFASCFFMSALVVVAEPMDEYDACVKQGAALMADGKFDEAAQAFKTAVDAYEKFGKNKIELANLFKRIALAYSDNKEYGPAEKYYKRALEMFRKELGPSHVETAQVLSDLGNLCIKEERLPDAETYLKSAVQIFKSTEGESSPRAARCLSQLGTLVYEKQDRFAEAETVLQECLAIREKAFGPNHLEVADSLGRLTGLYIKLGRYKDGDPFASRALSIRLGVPRPDRRLVDINRRQLLTIYRNEGKYAEAEVLEKQLNGAPGTTGGATTIAVGPQQNIDRPKNPKDLARLNNEGSELLMQQDFSGAVEKYRQALLMDVHYTLAQKNMARALNNYAMTLPPDKAVNWYRLAEYASHSSAQSSNLNAALKSTNVDPSSPEQRIKLGENCWFAGDFIGAYIEFSAADSIKSDEALTKKLDETRPQARRQWQKLLSEDQLLPVQGTTTSAIGAHN